MASRTARSTSWASPDDVKTLMTQSLKELGDAVKTNGTKYFPNGVELIQITVKVSNIEVSFKVAGPKPAALLGDAAVVATPAA